MDAESIQFVFGMVLGAVCVFAGYIQGRRHGRALAMLEIEHRRVIRRS